MLLDVVFVKRAGEHNEGRRQIAPPVASGIRTGAAWATPGWRSGTFSTSFGSTFSPLQLSMSPIRPTK